MIKIVTDTTAGLPANVTEEEGVAVLPQIIIFGDEAFRDDTELDTKMFLEKLRSSPDLPTTSAPPPELYHPILKKLTAEGLTVLCLHPSSELSRTVQSAHVATQEYPDADIRVIDTRTIAAPLGMMVLKAAKWARENVDADTIVARIQDMMAQQHIYFLVDTLEYLHRGGRIGGARALLGGVLQIKPILAIRDGRVEPFEQQRTKKRALARLKELVLQDCPADPGSLLCVMHADAEAEARQLADDLASELNLPQVPIYQVPPAIVVHAGPGVLGAGFFVTPEA